MREDSISTVSRVVGEEQLKALARVLASEAIRVACLFGSLLEQRPARDVDLAVLFREYTFERYLETLSAASRALGTERVDLVVLNRANPRLKLRALLEGKAIFAETPLACSEAIAEALFEYEDYRRFMAGYRLLLDRRCKEGLSVAERKVDRERIARPYGRNLIAIQYRKGDESHSRQLAQAF